MVSCCMTNKITESSEHLTDYDRKWAFPFLGFSPQKWQLINTKFHGQVAFVSSSLASEGEQARNTCTEGPVKGFSGSPGIRPALAMTALHTSCSPATCPPSSCAWPTSDPPIESFAVIKDLGLSFRPDTSICKTEDVFSHSQTNGLFPFSVLDNFSMSNHSVSLTEGTKG